MENIHFLVISPYRGMNELVREVLLSETKVQADCFVANLSEVDSILDTAFGVNTEPTWDDFLIFLESRCIPRTRCGLNYYLDAVGVSEYDPIQLVEKTHGRMAEDHKWLKIT